MIWRKLLQALPSLGRMSQRRQQPVARIRRNRPGSTRLRIEPLEVRCLLSVAPGLAGSHASVASLLPQAGKAQLTVDAAWFEVIAPAEPVTAWASAASFQSVSAVQSARQAGDRMGLSLGVPSAQWLVRVDAPLAAAADSVAAVAELLDPQSVGAHVVRGLGLRGWLLLAADLGTDPQKVQSWLQNHPMIAHWELNGVVSTDRVPNDSDFSRLWALNNVGQGGGTPDADIDAPETWEAVTGSRDVVVAVIDTGIDYTHPDLWANMWTNPGEIAGNGIDDDGNGFVDDVYGYDFANGDSDPMDDEGHGTHVAGIIAAAGNNGQGVAGVNWVGSLMALKFLDEEGSGTTSDAVLAVNYATLMRTAYGINVRVTNNSWGGGNFSQALHDAIQAAGDAGILFVVAAGNEGADLDRQPRYPPAYQLSNIVVVAATDRNDQLARFSNFGAGTVDLAAPGVGIYSTTPGDHYAWFDGTSMATPYVAGTAALLWSAVPNATAAEVRSALLGGVDRLPSLEGLVASAGRLNARGALDELGLSIVAGQPGDGTVLGEAPTDFVLRFSAPLSPQSLRPERFLVNNRPADRAVLVDAATVGFQFNQSPVLAEGPQHMRAEPGLAAAASGGALSSAWQAVFYYDTLPLTVTATEPGEGEMLDAVPLQVVLHFSEPIDAASVGAGDLVVSVGRVSGAEVVGGNSVAYRIEDLPHDGRVEYRLLQGAVSDWFGNPGLAYDGSFSIDDPRFERLVYQGPPLAIRDFQTVGAEIVVDQSVSIGDLDVVLHVAHSYTADLEAVLVAPSGVRVTLFAHVGGAGANFAGTIFDDEAPVAIADGTAPFRGRYRPTEPLWALDGSDLFGTWILEIHDASALDEGALYGWELLVERGVEQPPQVRSIDPIPDHGEVIPPVRSLTIHFSKPLDPASVDPATWELRQAGADGRFDTGDDQLHRLLAAPYTGGVTVELAIEGAPLQAGEYRLTIPAGGVRDRYGIPLDGDGDGNAGGHFVRYFTVPAGRWYRASDVPVQIADQQTVISRLYVEESFTLADVDVLLDVTHTYAGDLDIYLIAPNGTRIELATDVGGSGDNFSGTLFDQQAPVSIVDAAAPFAGRFRPEGSLDVLAGGDAQGLWALEITDDSPWDTGTLLGWALALKAAPPRIVSLGPLPEDPQHAGKPIDRFVVQFSAAMDAAALTNPQNWELRHSGADGRFGTGDDRLFPLELSADSGARTVSLATHSGRLPPGTYRFRASSGGLRDAMGAALDGNGDGIAGDHFLSQFAVRSQVRYAADNVPSAIWDRRTVLSAVYVPDSFTVSDVDVGLDITHTYDADLHVWLVAPNGRRVKLFGGVGGSGNHFSGTVFDDAAAMPIAQGTAPFAAVFRPAEPLGVLAGIDSHGTWLLEISDNGDLHAGTLNSWHLVLDGAPLTPPRAVAHWPQGIVAAPVTELSIEFDGPMDGVDIAPADGLAVLSGPNGPIAVDSYHWLDSRRLQLAFAPQSTAGGYRLAISPQVRSTFGVSLDQDGDQVPGEPVDDVFVATFAIPTVLGAIEWRELAGLNPAAGPLWFRIETLRAGVLSIEATALGQADRLQLALLAHDSQQAPLATVEQQGTARIDWQAPSAGSVYYVNLGGAAESVHLRLANLVVPQGDTVTVFGTAADDWFTFSGENRQQIGLNGLRYEFPAAAASTIAFYGGGGNDSAHWTGSPAAEQAELSPGRATLQGPGFQLLADRVESITIVGGGGTDVAVLASDPAAASTFVANGSVVQMEGAGRKVQLQAFSQVLARASGRPDDTATFYDSPGDDVFRATGQAAVLRSPGWLYQAEGFGRIDAYALHGGADKAVLATSTGENLLVATPRYVTLRGSRYYQRAVGFSQVDASGGPGADDVAKFYDSAGSDKFVATADYAMLVSPGFTYRTTQFDRVYAFAGAGGSDEAKLYGDEGHSSAVLTPEYASLKMAQRYYQAVGFQSSRVQAGAGPASAALYGSPGNDVLTATPAYARLSGAGFSNSAVGFPQVNAYSGGGNDLAQLYDSPGNDLLVSTPYYTTLTGANYSHRATGFSTVSAYATAGGYDEARLYDSSGNDQLVASPQYAVLSGSGFLNRVAGFEKVVATSTAGGDDTARLYDSTLIDSLHAEGRSVRLHNDALGFEILAKDFARVFAFLQNPDDVETVAEEVDYLVTYHLL